jgi:predicted phage baseplate assembly protein
VVLRETTFHKVTGVRTALMTTKSDAGTAGTTGGYTARVTQLTLDPAWLQHLPRSDTVGFEGYLDSPELLRGTVVYTQTVPLDLAEEPLDRDVEGGEIELDGLYDGLEPGRWIIVQGERTDIPDVAGVTASELVMVAAVEQRLNDQLPGDTVHTVLKLANKLAYTYDASTVRIYGNVIKGTNGQTVAEVLGNGDATRAVQKFALHQSPLTYVSAVTPEGAQSTLAVRVNGVEWHEQDSLAGLESADRGYITETDDADQTSVIFGNGEHGARLPTGAANVKSVYRYGIGKPGNVKAGQVSLLATRPLGVTDVINPLRSSGGADRDSRDQARRNIPMAVMALDRLVSVKDYADFARIYAGIGKASAVRLSDGRRQLVHVTIAGVDDIPIDTSSDLFGNLVQSLQKYGDPFLPAEVAVRRVRLIVMAATVRLLPDYAWEQVEPKLRVAILTLFSFDARALGQPAFVSEAIAAIQQVEGIAWVDVTTFDSVPEKITPADLAAKGGKLGREDYILAEPARIDEKASAGSAERIVPAELVFMTPDIPDTLILSQSGG